MNDLKHLVDSLESLDHHLYFEEDVPPDEFEALTEMVDILKAIAKVTGTPPKRGRWVPLTGMAPPEYHGHKICSLCECMAPHDPIHVAREILPKYCPGCGAEMDGEERCKAVDRDA